VPVVDGNVCRVLSRLTGIANHIKAPIFKDDLGWKLAEQIVCSENDGHAGDVNQALMELGATYCAPSGSGIDDDDPLKEFYMSTVIGRSVVEAMMTIMMVEERENGSIMDVNDVLAHFNHETMCGDGADKCRLCHSNGVPSVLAQICQDWIDYMASEYGDVSSYIKQRKKMTLSKIEKEVASKIGHGAFPVPPPKKAKREEVLAVAAISLLAPETLGRKSKNGEEKIVNRWLMVKRPKEGLLAGQWEFPSVCVWDSTDKQKDGKKGKKAMVKNGEVVIPIVKALERKRSLQSFLENMTIPSLLDSDDENQIRRLFKVTCKSKRINLSQEKTSNSTSPPLEHIFSHVRHTMWVEHGHIQLEEDDEISFDFSSFESSSMSWKTEDGREVRWMSELDMKKVGVTSGVKKILAAVLKKRK